jgi:hypothetical protein
VQESSLILACAKNSMAIQQKIFEIACRRLAPRGKVYEFGKAFNRLARNPNREKIIELIYKKPEDFLELQPRWREVSAALPTGGFCADGPSLLRALGRARLRYQGDAAIRENARRALKKAQREFKMFQEWLHAPRTEIYLAAEVNRSVILEAPIREELGMIPRLPTLYVPLKRGAVVRPAAPAVWR